MMPRHPQKTGSEAVIRAGRYLPLQPDAVIADSHDAVTPMESVRSRQVTHEGAAALCACLQFDQHITVEALFSCQDRQKIHPQSKADHPPGSKFGSAEQNDMSSRNIRSDPIIACISCYSVKGAKMRAHITGDCGWHAPVPASSQNQLGTGLISGC